MKSKIMLPLKYLLIITMIVIILLPNILQAQKNGNDIIVGKAIKIQSKILNEDRYLYVYTPVGYNTSQDNYPVLYVLDGNNNFFFSLAISNFLARNGRMPKTIVIGIPNINRTRDFTPSINNQTSNPQGADKFIKFFEEELIPYIEQNYRAHSFRILYGHSLCGMFSIYTLFTKPELFNAHIAVSPYIAYRNEYVIKQVASILKKQPAFDNYLFITVGNEPSYFNSLEKMCTLLKNHAEQLQWIYYTRDNEDHGSVPLKSLYDGLEFIYSDWLLPNDIALKGIKSIKKYYQDLYKKYGYKIEASEALLNNLGYQFLTNGHFEKAITIFRNNVELYPNSVNVYDSLGEGLELNKQYKLALKNYKKAVELAEKVSHPNTNIYKQHYERVQKKIN